MFGFKSTLPGLLLLLSFLLCSTHTIAAALPPAESGLEARQVVQIIEAIFGLVGIVESGIEDLINLGKLDAEEHAVESAFTQQMVRELRSKYPNKNVLIYHDQKSKFNGVNVAHQHVECSLDFFTTTQGYEVDVFDSGTFTLVGDGGYINWCFDGNYVHDGNSVTFNPITT